MSEISAQHTAGTVEQATPSTQPHLPDEDGAAAAPPTGSVAGDPAAAATDARAATSGRPRAPWTLERAGSTARNVVAYVVVLAVLAAMGIAAIALVQGTWAVNPVLTGSMRPGLAVGGVVISERVPVNQLAVRDVIVFQSPFDRSEQVVHRIVAITVGKEGQRFIKTQGDANRARDPWTLTILGGYVYRVRWSLPLLGYVAVAYENHRGIALILAGVVLLALAIPAAARTRRRAPPAPAPPTD